MQIRLFIAMLALVLCTIAAHADEPKVIRDSEAIRYVGKEVEVRGRVVLCDDQPTGYDIYQFRKRISQTNVRWVYFGSVQNSDRSTTHYDSREKSSSLAQSDFATGSQRLRSCRQIR